MAETRRIRKVLKSKSTIEGAGVHLKRVFGFSEVPLFDPFLMLDDFRSDNPVHYIRGFPWHPHRGIETITYVLDGSVEKNPFSYEVAGENYFDMQREPSVGNGSLVLLRTAMMLWP